MRVMFILYMFCCTQVYSQSADEVFRRVQTMYGESESLRAQFFSRLPGTATPMRGTLLVKRGNKFRLDMNGRTITCNGQIVWNYEHSTKKILISTFKNNPATISPEKIFLSFPKTYTPAVQQENAADGKILRLTLTPVDARDAVAGMQEVIMRLTPGTYQLREIKINDGTTTYQWMMTELTLQAKLKNEQFEYKPPKGAQIIDLRD